MTPHAQPLLTEPPGPMTRVMRAAGGASHAKVLRAAIVRGGRVLEERILPPHAHLTVGPSEQSTFVVTLPTLTGSTRLIESTADGYRLCPVAGSRLRRPRPRHRAGSTAVRAP